jgi:hypothetical protein
MHFEMLEFNPNMPGLQKFMSSAEEAVLRCLWAGPMEGSDIDKISAYLEGKGFGDPDETMRRSKEATESLIARGILKLRLDVKGSSRILFQPVMDEGSLKSALISDIIEKLLTIFPETTREVIREIDTIERSS